MGIITEHGARSDARAGFPPAAARAHTRSRQCLWYDNARSQIRGRRRRRQQRRAHARRPAPGRSLVHARFPGPFLVAGAGGSGGVRPRVRRRCRLSANIASRSGGRSPRAAVARTDRSRRPAGPRGRSGLAAAPRRPPLLHQRRRRRGPPGRTGPRGRQLDPHLGRRGHGRAARPGAPARADGDAGHLARPRSSTASGTTIPSRSASSGTRRRRSCCATRTTRRC
jgi:hypothetical protein